MKKAGKRLLLLFLIASEVMRSVLPVFGEEEIPQPGNLYALSAVLLDGDSGRILYEKNGGEKRPMASTTKIMTCILILENGNLEDTAKTSAYAASMPKVHLGAAKDEEFYVKDLLYSLMLESHNDSAVILAEYAEGSVQEFAGKMNEKAREIGCEDTWFITPNGLDAQEEIEGETREHSTTAADLARIMKYCIMDSPQKDAFLEITGTPSYTFQDVSGKRSFSCNNHNAFLSMMEGALSGKTGFTARAGYCYVGALQRDGKTFVAAVLGCGWPNNKSYKWADTRRLMEYGLEHYTLRSLSEAELPWIPSEIVVKNGQSKVLGEKAKAELVRVLGDDQKILLREDEKIEVSYQGQDTLEAPVKKGQKAGELIYTAAGQVWKREDVVIKEGVGKADFSWCLRQTMERLAAGAAQ